MHFNAYKPLVFTSGYSTAPLRKGQKIADVKAAIDYDTGEVCYFRVTIGADVQEHNFLTFEEAMIFYDVNDLWFDSTYWSNPKIGMMKFWCSRQVTLEDGRTIYFKSQFDGHRDAQ